MTSKANKLLAVSLYGMDGRAYKTMTMFLQGICKGIVQVVAENEADIDIIDADAIDARVTLENCLSRQPLRPIIILSLEKLKIEHTIFVAKPAKTEAMLAAFKEAEAELKKKKKKTVKFPKIKENNQDIAKAKHFKNDKTKAPNENHIPLELVAEKKVYSNPLEQKKTEKHKAAMMIDEQSFSSFIGIVRGIDFNDVEQWPYAKYNPKRYYQGYVQSSIKVAYEKGWVVKLNSGWKSLIILPHSHELWLDADDQQLRAFASVEISAMPVSGNKVMTLAKVNSKEIGDSIKLDKFHEIDAFVWKLACWTSKGRYPKELDIAKPVYLKQWPNFTRLVITPHAMQITALLIIEPRTMLDIIQILKIKPEYVFIFISAAYATGILEQAKRLADTIITPKVPVVKSVKKKGLFSRILNKLRGNDHK